MAISLKDITKTGQELKPQRIILYAVNGFGKTTFASQSCKPYVIQTEDGVGRLSYDRTSICRKLSDVTSALHLLATEEHSYESVWIDTLDALETLIFDRVCEDKGVKNIEDIGYAKGPTFALSYWAEILLALDYLRDQKNMWVGLTAHSLIKTFNPPDAESYDRYRLDMHDKSASRVKDWSDIILFGNYKLYTKKSGEGFHERHQAIGEGERVIYTEERPSHWGKNRWGLPYELALPLEDSWGTFYRALMAQMFPNKEVKPEQKVGKKAA